MVAPSFEDIAHAAANKLRLPPKSIRRLVLKTAVGGHAVGTELPAGDCRAYLKDGALLFVDRRK